MKRAVVSIGICLFGCLAWGGNGELGTSDAQARGQQVYHLLGPAPRGGDLLRHETEFHMPRARMDLSAGGKQMSGRIDIKSSESEDIHILAARGHQLLRYKRKVNLNRTVSHTTLNGQRSKEVEHGALEGRTVMAKLNGSNWRHSLLGARPNAKQKRAMLELSPPEPDTPYYPRKAVAPGHSWKVQAKGLAGLLGAQLTSISGSARMKFSHIHRVRRRRCARIIVSLVMRAKMPAGKGNMVHITLRMRGYIDRAILLGMDLRMRLKGSIKMVGGLQQNGQHITMNISGPLTMKARNVMRSQARVRRVIHPKQIQPTKPVRVRKTPHPEPATPPSLPTDPEHK